MVEGVRKEEVAALATIQAKVLEEVALAI